MQAHLMEQKSSETLWVITTNKPQMCWYSQLIMIQSTFLWVPLFFWRPFGLLELTVAGFCVHWGDRLGSPLCSFVGYDALYCSKAWKPSKWLYVSFQERKLTSRGRRIYVLRRWRSLERLDCNWFSVSYIVTLPAPSYLTCFFCTFSSSQVWIKTLIASVQFDCQQWRGKLSSFFTTKCVVRCTKDQTYGTFGPDRIYISI